MTDKSKTTKNESGLCFGHRSISYMSVPDIKGWRIKIGEFCCEFQSVNKKTAVKKALDIHRVLTATQAREVK